MSKAQLASKAGLSRAAITYYEKSHFNPSLKSLKKLAGALSVSVDRLISLEKETGNSHDLKIRLLFHNVDKLDHREILFLEKMCEDIHKKSR